MPGAVAACAGVRPDPRRSSPTTPWLLCGVSTPRPHVNPSLPSPPLRRGGTPCRLTPTRMSRARLPVDDPPSFRADRVTRACWGFFCDSCGVRGQGSGGCHRGAVGGAWVWLRSGGGRLSRAPASAAGYPGPDAQAPGFCHSVRPPRSSGSGGPRQSRRLAGGEAHPSPSPSPGSHSFDYDLRSDETTR